MSSVPQVTGLLQNTSMKNAEVSGVADKYTEYFDKSKETSVEDRKSNYADMVNAYYDLATDFYEYGWGQSFHFATNYVGEPLKQAIARHEHYLALRLGLTTDHVVLDTGCGVGGPAREIARFSGCKVVGINNNAYQITRAEKHTKTQKLEEQVSFVKGDFMNIPKPDATFDHVYAIEATCHAPNKVGIYSEIFRVLKPGGKFAAYEWCMTESYDPNNERDKGVKHGIEVGDGLPDLSITTDVVKALKEVGFEVIEAKDLADESEVPWYAPLEGGFSLSNFRQSAFGRFLTGKMVWVLESLRLAPKGTCKTHDFLIEGADNLVLGGQTGIFTPMYFFIVRKPE